MELSIPETFAAARGQLMPVLRRRTEPNHAWIVGWRDPSQRLLRHNVAPFLSELVVLDLPDVRVYVNATHLERWGVDASACLAAARQNLRERATLGLGLREEDGLWQLAANDGYESSRLLLPRWLEAFRGQVQGNPVAVVPGNRVLLVGGDGDLAQVERLLDIGWAGFRQAGDPISPVVYSVDASGALVTWNPAIDHPLRWRALGSTRLLSAYEYAEQREQLADCEDVAEAVAAVTLIRKKSTGQAATLCQWERSRTGTLLPVTDLVVLVVDGEEYELGWDAIADLAGGCLVPTDHNPIRYRARWPLERTLDELMATAKRTMLPHGT